MREISNVKIEEMGKAWEKCALKILNDSTRPSIIRFCDGNSLTTIQATETMGLQKEPLSDIFAISQHHGN